MRVIDDLKRLERTGSEESRATEKLINAAKAVTAHIAEQFVGFRDGTYHVSRSDANYVIAVNNGGAIFSRIDVSHCGSVTWSDPRYIGREAALKLASSIASGLLTEIADWLDERKIEAKEATAILEEHVG